jgi:hypothetical protein
MADKLTISTPQGIDVKVSKKAVRLGLYPGVHLPASGEPKGPQSARVPRYGDMITRSDVEPTTPVTPPAPGPHVLDAGTPEAIEQWLTEASLAGIRDELERREAGEVPGLAERLVELERAGKNRSTVIAYLDGLVEA